MRTSTRLLVVLVALALPMAVVATASGAPDKNCDDDKWADHPTCVSTPTPTTTIAPPSGSVEVTIDANLIWVQEAGDSVFYDITVSNGTDGPVTVTDSLTTLDTTVAANTTAELQTSFVVPADLLPPFGGDIATLTNTVTAAIDEADVASADATIDLHHDYQLCDFDQTIETWACIWKPGSPGDWRVTVDPTPIARATGVNSVTITLRDHIPGNWCGPGLNTRWRWGDDPIEWTFTIPPWPSPAEFRGDAVCPIGGAGGDFFDVGSPGSFYLVVSGDVTVEKLP